MDYLWIHTDVGRLNIWRVPNQTFVPDASDSLVPDRTIPFDSRTAEVAPTYYCPKRRFPVSGLVGYLCRYPRIQAMRKFWATTNHSSWALMIEILRSESDLDDREAHIPHIAADIMADQRNTFQGKGAALSRIEIRKDGMKSIGDRTGRILRTAFDNGFIREFDISTDSVDVLRRFHEKSDGFLERAPPDSGKAYTVPDPNGVSRPAQVMFCALSFDDGNTWSCREPGDGRTGPPDQQPESLLFQPARRPIYPGDSHRIIWLERARLSSEDRGSRVVCRRHS